MVTMEKKAVFKIRSAVASALLLAVLLMSELPSQTALAYDSPYIITNSGGPYYHYYQHHLWRAKNRWWVFYWDGASAARFTSSPDGQTDWVDTVLRYDVYYMQRVDCYYNGTHFFVVAGCVQPEGYAWFRMGEPHNDGTITWNAEWQNIGKAGAYCTEVSIVADNRGYPWVLRNDETEHRLNILTSTTRDGTWSMRPGFPYELDVSTDTEGCIMPVGDNSIYVVWSPTNGIDSPPVQLIGRLWNGTSGAWAEEETVTSSIVLPNYKFCGTSWQNEVLIAFTDNSNLHVKIARKILGQGWTEEYDVSESPVVNTPTMMKLNETAFLVSWGDSNHKMWTRTCNGSEWGNVRQATSELAYEGGWTDFQTVTSEHIEVGLLFFAGTTLYFDVFSVFPDGNIIVPDDFSGIQEAINQANAGDTIFVRNGMYLGPIVINKTLTIKGENTTGGSPATIIDEGSNEPSGSVVLVAADNVKMSDLTIQHCRAGGNAVWLDGYDNMTFSDNIITGCNEGVRILHSSGNVISNNTIRNCYYNTGLGFNWAYDNIVYGNIIENNNVGIGGNHWNNTFFENVIKNNKGGFGWGISDDFYDCVFFHNNIIDNGDQVSNSNPGSSIWDNGYPSGGNYWSDYTGSDSNHDGIGDTPYAIDSNNIDRYPLVTPWPQAPEYDLVGYWKFDEGSGDTAYDSSGKSNDGNVIGASWADGIKRRALNFDGLDDYVEVMDSQTLNFSSFTVMAWVRFQGFPGYYGGVSTIVARGNDDLQNGHFGLEQYYEDHSPFNPAIFRFYLTENQWYAADATTHLVVGTWYHVAGTYNGTALRIYVNGTLEAEAMANVRRTRNSLDLQIGALRRWSYFTNGAIDEVELYRRALSQDEVVSCMRRVYAPTIEGISRIPISPSYLDKTWVTANITDDAEVDNALLSYSWSGPWHNVTMSKMDDTFNASIPAQAYGTFVQYKIYANDTNGNWAISRLYSYTVGDYTSPEAKLSRSSEYPLPGQKVKVYANVTEPVNASGVKSPVLFSFRANAGPWWNTTMVYNEALGLYEATIFGYEKHDYIEYFVKAVDNAGNINTAAIQHYEVLRCDVNHNGVVDVPDIYLMGKAWNTKTGEPGFIPEADINEDGVIDEIDLSILNTQYGKDP